VDAIGNALKTGATEGATNAAQTAISQVGQTIGTPGGVTVDPHEALGSAVLGAGTGIVAAGPRGARDLSGAVRFRDVGGDLTPATAAAANRIVERAGGDLGSLKDPKVAYRATSDASADVVNELTREARALSKVTTLSPEADNALARARRGERLTDGDLAAINDATDGVSGGDRVRDLARQAVVFPASPKKGTTARPKSVSVVASVTSSTARRRRC
jgi:hypothetical protein